MNQKDLDLAKKLINKANSTDSESEAQALMNKVQELLVKNGITMQQVEQHELKGTNSVIKDLFALDELADKRHGKFVGELLKHLARAYLCHCIFTNGGKGLWILGKTENIIMVREMLSYLLPVIYNLEKEGWRTYGGNQKRGAYRRDFLMGCSDRIGYRLIENMEKLKQEVVGTTALVLYNDKQIDEYKAKEFPFLRTIKGATRKNRDGRSDGAAAGDRVNLNNQIGGRGSNTGLLK